MRYRSPTTAIIAILTLLILLINTSADIDSSMPSSSKRKYTAANIRFKMERRQQLLRDRRNRQLQSTEIDRSVHGFESISTLSHPILLNTANESIVIFSSAVVAGSAIWIRKSILTIEFFTRSLIEQINNLVLSNIIIPDLNYLI